MKKIYLKITFMVLIVTLINPAMLSAASDLKIEIKNENSKLSGKSKSFTIELSKSSNFFKCNHVQGHIPHFIVYSDKAENFNPRKKFRRRELGELVFAMYNRLNKSKSCATAKVSGFTDDSRIYYAIFSEQFHPNSLMNPSYDASLAKTLKQKLGSPSDIELNERIKTGRAKESKTGMEEGRTMTKGMQNLLEALKSKKPLYIINAPYKSCKPLVYKKTIYRSPYGPYADGPYGNDEQVIDLNEATFAPESGGITIAKKVPKINASKRCKLTNPAVRSFWSGEAEAYFNGNQLSSRGRDISIRHDKYGLTRSIGPNAPTHTWEARVDPICLNGSLIVTTKGAYETNCELTCSEWADSNLITIALGKQRAEQIARKQFNGSCSK